MEFLLKELADRVGGRCTGDGAKVIRGVESFDSALEDQVTFADGPKFLKRLSDTKAGAVVVPPEVASSDKNLLQVSNPKVAFAKIVNLFYPSSVPYAGISSRAVIGRDFKHGQDPSIGPLVFIGDSVTIGDRVALHAGVFLGNDVVVGDDVLIYPNVSVLARCRLGSRITINAGTVVGSDGYGFAPDGEIYEKIPQVGIVQIDDDVEIGANNAIDRGTFGKTWIQRGVKTDNLVHIAHNVIVGENTLLVAQVGIAGSTTIGKHVIAAGQVGISGHLTIGDNVIIGPQSGISKSVNAGEIVTGSPEMPHRQWLKMTRVLPQLPEIKRKLLKIEKLLKERIDLKKP
jgi:UDP-3-O-[3-hydroxymyristoyl] glucosamine N-acyltransferase